MIDSFLVQLNSAEGQPLNGDMLSHVQFNFKTVFKKDPHIERVLISVDNAQIPCSFYAIHAGNDRLDYIYNGNPFTINITHGNYNGNSVSRELISKFLSNSTPFTSVSVSSLSGKMTFNASVSFTIKATSTCSKILGIGPTDLTSVSNSVTCPISINLLGITTVRIGSSKLLVNGLTSKNNASLSILSTIPVDNQSASFGLLSFVNMTLFTPILHLSHLSEFDIMLIDQDGEFIDFRGIDWTMTLKFDLIHKEKPESVNRQLLQAINMLTKSLTQQPDGQQPEQQPDEQQTEQQEEMNPIPDSEPQEEADMGDLDVLLDGFRDVPPDNDLGREIVDDE